MYELKAWKKPGCALALSTAKLSQREPWSKEINEIQGEGGGLNATYQTVEAVAVATSLLVTCGLEYGKDFLFKTGGSDSILLDFRDEEIRDMAKDALGHVLLKTIIA